MHSELYKKVFENRWPPELGGVMLAFLNILMVLHSGPLGGIYVSISSWGKWIHEMILVNIQTPAKVLMPPIFGEKHVLIYGFILGVFLSAILAKQLRLRREGGYIQGLTGGALMGIGASLANGCNIGAFYSSTMALSLSGFIMMIGLMIGAYIGGKFMMWRIERRAERLLSPGAYHTERSSKEFIKKDSKHAQAKTALAVALFVIFITSLLIFKGEVFLAIILLFGLSFGIVFQRSAFCFTSAFREIFLTKSTRMMRSLLISLMIGIIGFAIIKASGFRPTDMYVMRTGWYNLLGGVIFGFGMTITGG